MPRGAAAASSASGTGAARSASGAAHYAVRLVAVGTAYFILAKAGLELASIHPSASPIWPPTGFALAALLLGGYRLWPAIFAGALVANVITAGSLYTSAAIAAGNALEALISAWLLNRWAGGRNAFATPLGIGKFALVSLAPGAVVSATVGVTSLSLAGYASWLHFGSIWKTWWLGDVAGALVVAPVVVLWAEAGPGSLGRAALGRSILLYAGALAVGVAAFSPLIEQTGDRGALAFLAVLPLLWAALRYGPRDTATVALLLSACAVWGTLLDGGPFARPTLNESFLLLLAFMLSTAVPSLALSVDAEMRRRKEESLRRDRTVSERTVQERTADLEAALAERARTEAELRHQRLHLLEAQRLAGLGSWMRDIGENRVTWSETLFEIFGIRPSDFKGTFDDFIGRVHPEDRATVMSILDEAVRTGGDFRLDARIVRPNGEIRHLQGAGRAITDGRGKTVRLLGVSQDATDRRRAEAALVEAQQALHQAQKMEALGQLTGGIAHDFNNILTAIANSLELVRGSDGVDAQQAARLERALQAARNGAALVQQLLVFARKQPVAAEPRDINEIVRATAAMLARGASENISLATDLAPDLKWARVDATQLQTAILNLALNARDAMPDGGTLRIATANLRPEAGHPAAECVAIIVSDTGIGMLPDVMARAFEPFFTTKEIGKGTGLGLSMVYSALRHMGGEAAIESAPGKGTTVRLLLPAIAPPASSLGDAPRPARAAASPAEQVSVLYVEDEPLVRLATVDVLESAGYRVCDATNAERALALLGEHPEIAIMVSDVGLPGMNGHALAVEARRRRPGLKVVFLTGYDRDRSGDALRRDPDVRHLDKPYQHEELFRAIGELLESR